MLEGAGNDDDQPVSELMGSVAPQLDRNAPSPRIIIGYGFIAWNLHPIALTDVKAMVKFVFNEFVLNLTVTEGGGLH
jgi:hypothetical protein